MVPLRVGGQVIKGDKLGWRGHRWWRGGGRSGRQAGDSRAAAGCRAPGGRFGAESAACPGSGSRNDGMAARKRPGRPVTDAGRSIRNYSG
jgi:hypothetical protein